MRADARDSQNVFAVVLAAGGAKRFGATKQLARLATKNGDESLVLRAARLAKACCGDRSLLVVGHDAANVAAGAAGQCRFLVVNERYADGLGTSVARAVSSIGHVADAVLLMLADQPMISERHLSDLIAAWIADTRQIVATAFGDNVGAPALVPSDAFHHLAALDADEGARALFHHPDFLVSTVRLDNAAIDIDTPDDLARVGQAPE